MPQWMILLSYQLILTCSILTHTERSKNNERTETDKESSNETQPPASCGIYLRDEAEQRNNERCAAQICETVHGRSKKRTATDGASEQSKQTKRNFVKGVDN